MKVIFQGKQNSMMTLNQLYVGLDSTSHANNIV